MLKNIVLLIICVFIILYIINNKQKEYFDYNPYSNYSSLLINSIENNKDNTYEYNDNKKCFHKNNLFSKPINISIAFKSTNMNNYSNSKYRKLFCKIKNTDFEFEQLLNNSLLYNNSAIYTGENKDGNEWEIISLHNQKLPPPPPGYLPPKLNNCGYLIRNIKFNRYLSYGFLLTELYNIQNDNIISEEQLNRNIVYTGSPEYINENYLWNIENVGCNKYYIRHIYSGLYLNSTIPNINKDNSDINSELSEINNFGEISCEKNKKTEWFIIPTEPNKFKKCEDPYTDCSSNLTELYSSVGGKGNCCLKNLDTKLCMQGVQSNKKSKVFNFPSAPWCGIKNSCI